MKKVLLIIIILIILVGCTKQLDPFDDHKIQISLLDSQILGNDTRTYSIQVKNNGDFTMKNTMMFLSYPKKNPNGIQGNPFKVEARVTLGNPNQIKPGEEVLFNVIAPIGDIYLDAHILDIDQPHIEFRGFHLTADHEEIPFGMTGNSLLFHENSR